MKKIKVVRIITRLNVGGPSLHVVNLNAGMEPSRFESVLVSGAEHPGEGSLLDYALSRGVRPVVIQEIVSKATLEPQDAKALGKLYRLIKKEHPDIVHTHTAKAGFVGRLAARMAHVPLVVHTYHGHILHGYFSPAKSRLLRRMEQVLARVTDHIVTVSAQVRRELVAYGIAPPAKISVIELGFDLAPFLVSQTQQGQFRRELGLEPGTPLVGIVGRIFPIKNHRLFLDAAALVAKQALNARFVIIGDGTLRQAMEDHACELGIAERVIFTGWRRDLPRIYADLDVLVVSSDNEGTPVSALEAMASGRPVVATRVGGLPDIIADTRTGFLVPPRDPDALAAAVLRVLREPDTAVRIGREAQTSARGRFTSERLVSDMESLYQQLLIQRRLK